MRQNVQRFDKNVTNWVVSTFGPSSRPFFEFMTMLGDPLLIGLITVSVMTYGFLQSNMRLVLSGAMIPAIVIVGAILKIVFERARPMTEYALNMKLQTFSFPSGHSSGSMIAFGVLAYVAFVKVPAPWNLIAGSLLAAIPIFVGVSRVYLGAHFPSDVLAGWLLGLLGFAVVLSIIRPFA